NKEPVQINYLLGSTSQLPLYMILVGAFISGGAAFLIILMPAWIKNKMEIRKLRRSIKDTEDDKSKDGF
ncbi:MAG: LapA family protein, partial [Nitrospira sp.]|nr:LapA family protein [Nitrospira sp.]